MAPKFHQFVRYNLQLCSNYSRFRSYALFPCQKRYYGVSSSESQYTLPGNIRTTSYKVGKYNINVAKVGHGPKAVFCLPGLLGSMEVQLMDQIHGFDKNKFTFYSWDQAGYGKSRPPQREFNDDSLAEDSELMVNLLKEFGHEKYSILGWSGGGVVGLMVASGYPELVENLVIWGSFAKISQKDADTFKWFQNTSNWGGKMKDVLVDYYGEEFFDQHWKVWMEVMIRIYTHHGGEFISKKLHHIKCPTFIIHGDQDALIHPSHANFIHENIPNSTLLIWKKGKHNVHLRYPQEFNEVVQQFLLRSNSTA